MKYTISAGKDKILTLDELVRVLDTHRDKKIVHCHGVFDLIHVGHIRHLQEAKALGDILVVTITPDAFTNKGPHRPAFTASYRAEVLASLGDVDYVAINDGPRAEETIVRLRPAYYVKGVEYRNPEDDKTGGIVPERAAVESVGGRIHFTEDVVFSSSTLINRFMSAFPDDVQQYLHGLRTRYDTEEIVDYVEQAANMKVLAIGETIVDEYVLCESLGKSGKEPILAVREMERQTYAGGTLAIANHLAGLAGDVNLVSFLGRDNSMEAYVRSQLDEKVHARFLFEDGPTIVKRRFVEKYPFQKLFEVYEMNGCEANAEKSAQLQGVLEELLPTVDLVLVADYGHGMIDRDTVRLICDKAPFLAVNCQVNAGNHGFNTISKYHRSDFISISEKELRLEARSRTRPIEDLVRETARRLDCRRMTITRGEQGCLCYDAEQGFFNVPAFTSRIVDRVGAGDTVLSVAAVCAAQNAPMELTAFLGNVAGAEAVGSVCNERALNKVGLIKHVVSLLK